MRREESIPAAPALLPQRAEGEDITDNAAVLARADYRAVDPHMFLRAVIGFVEETFEETNLAVLPIDFLHPRKHAPQLRAIRFERNLYILAQEGIDPLPCKEDGLLDFSASSSH